MYLTAGLCISLITNGVKFFFSFKFTLTVLLILFYFLCS